MATTARDSLDDLTALQGRVAVWASPAVSDAYACAVVPIALTPSLSQTLDALDSAQRHSERAWELVFEAGAGNTLLAAQGRYTEAVDGLILAIRQELHTAR